MIPCAVQTLAMLIVSAPSAEPTDARIVDLPGVRVAVSRTASVEAERIAGEMLSQLRRTAGRLGVDYDSLFGAENSARIDVYGSHEEKGLATGSVESVSVEADQARAAIVVDGLTAAADGRAEALLLLQRLYGAARSGTIREGAARVFGNADAVAYYRAAAAWIHAAGESTPLEALFDEDAFGRRSFLIQAPQAAVAVEVILETLGQDGLAMAWRGEPLDPGLLDVRFQMRLDLLVEQHADWMSRRRAERAACRREVNMRGFCFAHEGYAIHDGYISAMARRSLDRARALGADAVSITPFGYFRDPTSPEIRWRRRTGGRQGYETDEAIMVSAAHARELGMRTMLTPHLWGRAWRGEIEMATAEDWRAWFDGYGEFLVHNAFLAERCDFDWLAIGSELTRTTPGHGQDWARLARRARRLFAGGLIYNANWGAEMGSLEFTDALDAVGVDCYDSLSTSDSPTDAQLLAGAHELLDRIGSLRDRYQRPILLTEIGYPARPGAWAEPHKQDRNGPVRTDAQARCLSAFATAYAAREDDAVTGFFIWKWPTFDSWRLGGKTDYWPASAQALEILRRAFR